MTTPQLNTPPTNSIEEDIDTDSSVESETPSSSAFDWPIQPRPNPLTNFSHYSYVISWYMLSAEQYNTLTNSQVKTMAGYQLLMQTGGAPANNLTPESINAIAQNSSARASNLDGVNRNIHFDVDFSFERIEFKTLMAGNGAGSPTPKLELTMSVFEPYGVTLVHRLQQASNDLAQQKSSMGGLTYLGQVYLMVIRFYGYDIEGNLIMADNAGFSDSVAISEKFFPFNIVNLTFKLGSDGTTYQITGQPLGQMIANSDKFGAIPFNVELSAETVGELLLGDSQVTPPTASGANAEEAAANLATAKATVTRGLVAAINEYYRKEAAQAPASEGIVPHEIAIEFADGFNIPTATLVKPGQTSLAQTSMTQESKPSILMLSSHQQVAKNERNFSIVAGTQIVQFLDLVMRASSYITDQQLYDIEETVTKSGDTVRKVVYKDTEKTTSPLWYKIESRTEILGVSMAGNPSYKSTYRIIPYQPIIEHPALGYTKYRGSHKRYDYWFTGLNTEVLSFEQDFNMLYYQEIGPEDQEITANQRKSYNRHEVRKQLVSYGSAESEQGGINDSAAIAAKVAASLYSIADQVMSKLKILGDPEWIGEELFMNTTEYGPWTEGGINFGAQQPVYEINFNIPADYNLQSGLMEVNEENNDRSQPLGRAGDPAINYLYEATAVTSTFANGEFTQDIEGVVPDFTARLNRKEGGGQGVEVERIAPPPTPNQMLSEVNAREVQKEQASRERVVGRYEDALNNDYDLTESQREYYQQNLDRRAARAQPIAVYADQLRDAEETVVLAQGVLNDAGSRVVPEAVDGGRTARQLVAAQQQLEMAVAQRDNLRQVYTAEATAITQQVVRDD